MLLLKGIQKPYYYLRQIGFSHAQAHEWLKKDKAQVKLKQLTRLCFLLQCTPNDLLCFRPNATYKLYPGHPLSALQHQTPSRSLYDQLRALSPEKLRELQERLKEEEEQG